MENDTLGAAWMDMKEHLARQRVAVLEDRDRRGYEAQPQRIEDYLPWEEAAAWPEE